jgi:hypothetical protein
MKTSGSSSSSWLCEEEEEPADEEDAGVALGAGRGEKDG